MGKHSEDSRLSDLPSSELETGGGLSDDFLDGSDKGLNVDDKIGHTELGDCLEEAAMKLQDNIDIKM